MKLKSILKEDTTTKYNNIYVRIFCNFVLNYERVLQDLNMSLLNFSKTIVFTEEQVDKALGVVKLDSHEVLESYNKYKL